MTYPITAPASGAFPISTSWGSTGTFQNTDQDNTNAVANYAWGGVDTGPTTARVATTGAETYTIVSGSVTTINGTTWDGVSVAANDIGLIKDAPASSGAGSVGSSQPANGLYYVVSVSTNITVARVATMSSASSQANPAGRIVFVRPGGTANASTFWQVTSPFADVAFTYGTTAMQWKNYYLSGTGIPNSAIQQAGINNFNTTLQTQATVAATKYYVAGSALAMPAAALTGMAANKTTFVWNIGMAKNANGTGTFQILILRGTNGTTADTADVTQTIGTQTAALDHMLLTVQLTVTTIGGTGAYYWSMYPDNKAVTATGFGCVTGTLFNGTVSSVAMNTASLIFGIAFVANTGGTLPTVTIPTVNAAAYNMN